MIRNFGMNPQFSIVEGEAMRCGLLDVSIRFFGGKVAILLPTVWHCVGIYWIVISL